MPQAVYFLLLPNVLSLDVSGPAETLRLAGQFSLRYLSPVPQIVCSIGMTLSGLQPLPERTEDGAIHGAAGRRRFAALFRRGRGRAGTSLAGDAAARSAAAAHHPVCICSGALLAAQAGLLDGYQCTTHHDVIERIRRQAPAAQVKENRIFVEDRGVYTSAGITTGIDLALHGPSPLRRRPGARRRPRYGGLFPPRRGRSAAVATAALPQPPAPGGAPRAGRDGRRAGGRLVGAAGGGKSARQQPPPARLFRSHVGISVREYHEQLRLAVAQQRLQQGYGLEKAALAAGFSSGRQLRRAQQRQRSPL